MTNRRKRLRWTLAGTALALGLYVAYLAKADRGLDEKFRSVAEGAARGEVVALLGPPDTVSAGCRDLPTWMNRPVAATACAEELEYRAKLSPVYFTVGFDADGRAIAKYRYVTR